MAGLDAIAVEIAEAAPPSRSDLSPTLLARFESAATRATGRLVHAVPTWCTGATDAHWVRAVGTPVYGFQFIYPDADPTRLSIHCVDESIEASMLLPCTLSLAAFLADTLAS
jgi:acetylornithine deacetylase/succinyl-diaminopimelate desuccinylase-like protein